MITADTRILIVDDSNSFRALLKRHLTNLGYSNIVQTGDGFKALHLAQSFISNPENRIGLIFCDWNMPECNGIKFFKMLKEVPGLADVPFIMVTAENEVGHIMEAVNVGVKYYVVKPPDVEVIKKKIEAINTALGKS